jgi:cation diffusion facilitator family transporter
MADRCCRPPQLPAVDHRGYRRVLWFVLALNAVMFAVELLAGLTAGSVALQADALDFLGDAANYGISLLVLGHGLGRRALAGLVKGVTMGLFGLWVLGNAAYHALAGTMPEAEVMGAVGLLAFAVNVAVAVLLFRHRHGDSDRRSVWLCSRNDAIGNIAVVLAASGVLATGTNWPDLAVALLMAGLALSAAVQVIRQALGERRLAGGPHLRAAAKRGP